MQMTHRSGRYKLLGNPGGSYSRIRQTISRTASSVRLHLFHLDILGAMASGQGVTLIPEDAELTSVQAADILHVSRPFLIKLLEAGQIPYRKVGKHRRIRMEDVMNYKQAIDQERETVLERLVKDAQEQDMGYDLSHSILG